MEPTGEGMIEPTRESMMEPTRLRYDGTYQRQRSVIVQNVKKRLQTPLLEKWEPLGCTMCFLQGLAEDSPQSPTHNTMWGGNEQMLLDIKKM